MQELEARKVTIQPHTERVYTACAPHQKPWSPSEVQNVGTFGHRIPHFALQLLWISQALLLEFQGIQTA